MFITLALTVRCRPTFKSRITGILIHTFSPAVIAYILSASLSIENCGLFQKSICKIKIDEAKPLKNVVVTLPYNTMKLHIIMSQSKSKNCITYCVVQRLRVYMIHSSRGFPHCSKKKKKLKLLNYRSTKFTEEQEVVKTEINKFPI